MIWSKVIVAFEFLLLLAPAASKADQTPLEPGVEIRIEAVPKIATVGDPIQINLDIATPPGYRVDIPQIGQQAGDFFVAEFRAEPAVSENAEIQRSANSRPIPTGIRLHHRVRITVSVFKTGRFSFPSIQFSAITGEGKTYTLSTPGVDVEIKSVLDQNDQNLKDLKKQAEIEEPVRWVLWLTTAAAISVLGAVCWFLWQKHRKFHPHHPLIAVGDPLELAEADLRNLLARHLPENGLAKEFYILLSEIVKRILESGYGIPASEQTTSEIMDSLRPRPGLQTEHIERIDSFLLLCDTVKFARYIPSKSENDAAADSAFRILAQARAGRQSATVSGPSCAGGEVSVNE